ncbi:uncharacterized protein LOC129950145 [Eupeodes corollae]|uniref:uncharacterized protein LOC129950145 n=1 Tax=Eupeodes corollae TaxID=290404 RepID=UPI002492BDF2|nr:uncharacterized protein LOC129950145 [Eupeodes corollae]
MEEIFGSKPIMKNSHTITLWEETTEGLSMGRNSFPRPESIATTSAALTSTSNSQSAIQNIICPQAESSISTSSPAASNKKNRLSVKEKYYLMKEKKAAEKNEILRTYTEEKLKKVDEAERAKESRFERKEKLLREFFNKP